MMVIGSGNHDLKRDNLSTFLTVVTPMPNYSDEPLLEIDTVFQLVSEYQRRYALYYLMVQDRPVPLEELVEQVAIWNQTLGLDPLQERQEIRRELTKVHLPELQEHGVIEYDRQTQIAEPNEGFPLLRSVLQHAEQYEPFEQVTA